MQDKYLHTGRTTPVGPHFYCGRPYVELQIQRGTAKYRIRPVRYPVFLIGSDLQCDLVLGDARIDDIHSYIFITERQVSIRRLCETAILQVNGTVVFSSLLNHGDRIGIGPYEFRVRIDWKRPLQHPEDRISANPTVSDPRETVRRPADVLTQPEINHLLGSPYCDTFADGPGLKIYAEMEC